MHDEGLLQRCLDCLQAMSVGAVRDKNVFGMRGLMRGKQMFAAVGESSIIVKMAKGEFERALKQPGVVRFAPGGQSLGMWVEISEEVIADDPELREWLEAGLRGIGSAR
jgi:TfoX/Sxy family transcriptional regulator of competence genes